MAQNRGLRLDVTGPALRDITDALKTSFREFGEAASLRYSALIRQALLDVQNDPERPGSIPRPEIMIDGARTWHLALSRARVTGGAVRHPRHFLIYRCRGDGAVEVARLLHDSRDLVRHLPVGYRR